MVFLYRDLTAFHGILPPPRFPTCNITKNAETHPPPMHDVIIEQPLSELLLEKNLTFKKRQSIHCFRA